MFYAALGVWIFALMVYVCFRVWIIIKKREIKGGKTDDEKQ